MKIGLYNLIIKKKKGTPKKISNITMDLISRNNLVEIGHSSIRLFLQEGYEKEANGWSELLKEIEGYKKGTRTYFYFDNLLNAYYPISRTHLFSFIDGTNRIH